MNEKEFSKMLLSDEYILWLKDFMNKYSEIDDIYFVHNHRLSKEDEEKIDCLRYLFIELNKYTVKNNLNNQNIFCYYLKFHHFVKQV